MEFLFALILSILFYRQHQSIQTLREQLKDLNERFTQLELRVGASRVKPDTEDADVAAASEVTSAPVTRVPAADASLSTEVSSASLIPDEAVIDGETNDSSFFTRTTSAENESKQAQKPARKSHGSNVLGRVSRRVMTFLTQGNTVAKVGVVVLLIGLGFLVQLAAREGYLPVEVRLVGAGLTGIALLVAGWRLRLSRRDYALSLQGGGVGVLYLTVFASLQMYQLLPNALAFVLLAALAGLSGALAVLQNASSLAVLGALGGFLAPFFASGGGGSHISLFSYYLVLNAGIVLVAWFKAWRYLNMVGFIGTFIAGGLWGGLRYKPDLFASTEPFLISFFVLYLLVAVLFALRQPPKLKGLVDGSLVFALPVLVFSFQVGMLRSNTLGIAFSSVAMAGIYLLLAWGLRRRYESLSTLSEAFLAVGISFVTLTLPLALEASWTAAGWALEGAALIWIGVRQKRLWMRIFGFIQQLLASLSLALSYVLLSFGGRQRDVTLDAIILSVTLLISAYFIKQHFSGKRRWEKPLHLLYLSGGLLVWLSASGLLTRMIMPDAYVMPGQLLLLSLTAIALIYAGQALEWVALRRAALGLLPLGLLAGLEFLDGVLGTVVRRGPLFVMALTLVLVVMVLWWVLQRRLLLSRRVQVLWASLWVNASVVLLSLAWLSVWSIERVALGYWLPLLIGVVPVLAFLALSFTRVRTALGFPDMPQVMVFGVGPLAAFVWCWFVTVNTSHAGGGGPLPYVPLLNGFDVLMGGALLGFIRYVLYLRQAFVIKGWLKQGLVWASIVMGLLWPSMMIVRSVHHYFDVAFTFDALFASNVLQSSLTIFWTVFALISMLIATRRASRTPWWVGAGLLVLVVFKLFFVELSNVTAFARVISFVGVGVLLLLIAYIAPLPPAITMPQSNDPAEPNTATENVKDET